MEYVQLPNGQKLLIRCVVKEDACQMPAYLDQIAVESEFVPFGQEDIKDLIREKGYFQGINSQKSNCLFLIGEVQGKIIARLNFIGNSQPRLRHTGELGITVLRSYWGLGIGTSMIQVLLNWASGSGIIRKINLKVRRDNYRAIGLYTKLGFQIEGKLTRDFYVDGRFYDSLLMGLLID